MGTDLKAPRDALHIAIANAVGQPMIWGRDDCCHWAANVVRDITGTDPLADWRRAGWRSPVGALRRLGPGGLPDAFREVAHRLGWQPVDPATAITGDVGILVAERYAPFGAAAAVRLDDWWVGRDDNGVGFLPSNAAAEAWRPLPCRR